MASALGAVLLWTTPVTAEGITPAGLRTLMGVARLAAADFADLPVPHDNLPAILFSSAATIDRLVYGDREHDGATVLAAYHLPSQTIFLLDDWTGEDPLEQSILLHELVHHMQSAAGLKYQCSGLRERVAYEAQRNFLASQDIDLFEALDIDRLFYVVVTNCAFMRLRQ